MRRRKLRLQGLMQDRACQRMIRQKKLSATVRYDSQRLNSDKAQEARQRRVVGNNVPPRWLKPEFPELRIINKNIRCAWGIRTVNHRVKTAVQKECVAIRVKENGRECVVVMVHN